MRCTVDRFEGEIAVLLTEAKEEILIPKKYLPLQTREECRRRENQQY